MVLHDGCACTVAMREERVMSAHREKRRRFSLHCFYSISIVFLLSLNFIAIAILHKVYQPVKTRCRAGCTQANAIGFSCCVFPPSCRAFFILIESLSICD